MVAIRSKLKLELHATRWCNTDEIFGSDPISVTGTSVFIGTVLRYGR